MINLNNIKFAGNILTHDYVASAPLMYTLTMDSSKIDSDLTDFPLLIHLASDSGISNVNATDIFTEVGTASGKISIQLEDTTELDVEIESWDVDNQEAYLWVKVPQVSASEDISLNLYYGADRTISSKVHETGSAEGANVWTNNYFSVYHMGGYADSLNVYDLSVLNAPVGVSGGKINGGQLFDGVDDGLQTISSTFTGTDITLSCWIKTTHDIGLSQTALIQVQPAEAGRPMFALNYADWNVDSSGTNMIYTQQGPFGTVLNIFATNPAHNMGDGNWHHVVAVRDLTNNTGSIYIDGILGTPLNHTPSSWQRNVTGTLSPQDVGSYSITHNRYIGRATSYNTSFNGDIDEVRIENTARTADWVKAEYNSGLDNLITFS